MSAEINTTTVEAEPTSASTPMPLWLLGGTLLVALWGAITFDRQGGLMEAKVYHPYTSLEDLNKFRMGEGNPIEYGREVFEKQCAICHGTDGLGKPGQYPPLAGSEWVKAEGVNRIIRIPLLGLSGPLEVKGQQWNAAMPTMASLSDKDLAAALSYVRNSWGNKGSLVTAQDVAAIRKELGGRSNALSQDELKSLPEKK